jgi:hypothetical protein
VRVVPTRIGELGPFQQRLADTSQRHRYRTVGGPSAENCQSARLPKWCQWTVGHAQSALRTRDTRRVRPGARRFDASGRIAGSGKFTQGLTVFELNHGNLRAATSSSCATSGFIPQRLVNSVADVERLDHCQEAFARSCTRRRWARRQRASPRSAQHGRLPWDSQPPVSICISAGQRRSWVEPRVEAVLSGRHEGSNLQAVDGRSPIGSGEATMTNADSNPSHQIPILQFKNRQPFGQITSRIAATLYGKLGESSDKSDSIIGH